MQLDNAPLLLWFLWLCLQVMQWIAGYQEALGEFGVEEEDVAFPLSPRSGVSLLIGKYVDRTVATLSSWLNNIVEGDFKFEPKASAEGRMWTPGAVDFFRILNEQVAVVEEVNQGDMLLRVGQVRVQDWGRTEDSGLTAARLGRAESPT